MIPLGTGLFKTMYDTNMHNKIIKQNNQKENSKNNTADINSEKCKIEYESNQNIIEVKLKNSNRATNPEEISSKMSFNLVDLIN